MNLGPISTADVQSTKERRAILPQTLYSDGQETLPNLFSPDGKKGLDDSSIFSKQFQNQQQQLNELKKKYARVDKNQSTVSRKSLVDSAVNLTVPAHFNPRKVQQPRQTDIQMIQAAVRHEIYEQNTQKRKQSEHLPYLNNTTSRFL